jgi:demethylmenaquinone methyltransferase / 2-methoxy-6-polyprenyl-1,4-benzoquinol methylase
MQESQIKHQPEKKMVSAMFNNIAPKYDLLNTVLSFGIHKRWKRKVIRIFRGRKINSFLDVATGTADLAILAARLNPGHITGIDISSEMLNIGKQKVDNKKLGKLISLVVADSENIPFENDSFDAITAGFGVRNFEHLEKGLSEMLRVLRPGGLSVILEFSKPGGKFFGRLYHFYFTRLVPTIGRLISRNGGAYQYLPDSVGKFPSGKEFLKLLESCGFVNTSCKPLSMGIAHMYLAEKK